MGSGRKVSSVRDWTRTDMKLSYSGSKDQAETPFSWMERNWERVMSVGVEFGGYCC